MLEAKSKNPGIIEAIREVRVMGLGRVLKAIYDEHMKQIRDQNARDDYVREEGRAEGMEQGIERGIEQGIDQGREIKLIQMIQRKLEKGKTLEEIAEDLEEPQENVERICRAIAVCKSREATEIYQFMNNTKSRLL